MDGSETSNPLPRDSAFSDAAVEIDRPRPQALNGPVTRSRFRSRAAMVENQGMASSSTAWPNGSSTPFRKLPTELLCMVLSHLEPTLEPHLPRPFDKLLHGLRDVPHRLHNADLSSPTLNDLRKDGGPTFWNSHKNLVSFGLTCRTIYAHILPLRVVVLHTPKQLARFFLQLLENPERRNEVEELQIHQFLFLQHQVTPMKDALRDIKQNTRWDLQYIASKICVAAGNLNVPSYHTPNVILSTALLSLLPRVKALHIPYPRGYLYRPLQWLTLELWGLPDWDEAKAVSPPPSRVPASAIGMTVIPTQIVPSRLKSFQLTGVPHFHRLEYNIAGRVRAKPHEGCSYWVILFSEKCFKGLTSLDLQRIGDPMSPSFSPGVSGGDELVLPSLKSLKLHTLNLDETDLLRMLPAVPALEVLEVFFTCDLRRPNVSCNKQREIDDNLAHFPKGLKSLTIAYLTDPTLPHTPVPADFWSSRMRERILFKNLGKLANLESLGINMVSLIAYPSDTVTTLPPKLKHLRLYSATGITRAELDRQGEHMVHYETIDWEVRHYTWHMERLMNFLGNESKRAPEFKLSEVDIVRPLCFDQILERALTDPMMRHRQGWSDAIIERAPVHLAYLQTECQRMADHLRLHTRLRVTLMWSFEDQMGSDCISNRMDKLFWSGGH